MNRSIDALAVALEKLLGAALIVAVLYNFVNVVGRYIVGQTFISADEVQIYIMVYIAFLGAAVATWRRLHLRMDVLVHRLPPRVQRVLGVVELALTVVLAGFAPDGSTRCVKHMGGPSARSQKAWHPMWVAHDALIP